MGFLKNLAGIRDVVDIESLRPDLQECAVAFTGAVRGRFLADAATPGCAPPEIADSERFLAVLPTRRAWEDDINRYWESGVLYLTSERLFWRAAGGFEVPVADLSTGGIRKEAQRWAEHLHIGVGPGNNPSYKFDLGERTMSGAVKEAASFDFFVETLLSAVRASATMLPGRASTAAGSVADEIAKFAKLRDQGILSEDEFAAKKRELLG